MTNELDDLRPVSVLPISAAENLRRSSFIAAVVGVVAIAVSTLVHHPLFGVLASVGLALGAVNNLMLQHSVIGYATAGVTKSKFRGGVALRLGGITVLALAAALLFRPDGAGLVAGLAVFHLLMLISAALPVFRSMRPSA